MFFSVSSYIPYMFHCFLVYSSFLADLPKACSIDNPNQSLHAGGDVKQIITKNHISDMIEV